MSDPSLQEDIFKDYDPALMRRLLRYLKPYLAIFLLAITTLLLATAGDLSLPVLIQRGIDNYILPYHRGLRLETAPPETLARLRPIPAEAVIDGIAYFPASKLSNLSAGEKADLSSRGTLLQESYLLLREAGGDPELRALFSRYPTLFRFDGRSAAIEEKSLGKLPGSEIKLVRRDHYRGLLALSGCFLLILLGVLLFTFLEIYFLAYVGQRIMNDLRTGLFDHTLGLSLRFIDSNPVGRLVTRITNDVETINELFTTVISSFLQDVSVMIGVLAALFLLSPRLALITILTIPPVGVAAFLFRWRARDAYRRIRLAVSALNSFLSERLSGMHIVQLFAREKQSQEEFTVKNQDLLKANLGEMILFATFRPLIDLLSTTSMAAIIYFGASFLLKDLISLGVLIAFLNLIRKFYEPVMDLSEKYSILQSAMAGAERVFQLMDTQDRIPEAASPVSLGKVAGGIVFDRVGFAYKKSEPVLSDLSFKVEPGEKVAIVGYTGAGKSTIISLLTRLWDVQEGSILLDGVDIRHVPTTDLRRKVQAVLQEMFLFSGTIEENIRLGSDIPRQRVLEAARMVRADTFIERLPDGLDTVLTERGGNLSMGQRQLLSFARALAHNPDVLVLDEATGNIDTETEKLIQEALKRLLEGRTSLVIAHRLSTIRNSDRILVLHKGRLVEAGRHEELLALKGLYYNLYQMQFLARGDGG